MPTRIFVPPPSPDEESRQTAESISDIHYVVGTIVEGGKELLPGESVDEVKAAWPESEQSFKGLVTSLTPPTQQTPEKPTPITPALLTLVS